MRTLLLAALLLCVCLVGCGGGGGIGAGPSLSGLSNPAMNSVTLAAQIGNNTSASNSFLSQTNGNLGANNVSKLDIHSLLYSGNTTKIFAQLLVWFGQPDHMSVGYNSNDATQVERQVTDMISRGIDGVIVDWYGPNNAMDQATQLVLHEAEKHSGFQVVIMIDAGALAADVCSGCGPQETLVHLLEYLQTTYFNSSAYLKEQGQPVVTEFGIDGNPSIDWNALKSTATNLHFLFQDQDGFSHPLSNGSYSWVMPEMANYGLDYLSSFYDTGVSFAQERTVGAAYKGFNDNLASWGSNRVMDQQCGQTWLQTFAQANALYSTNRQLPYLQVVTWNDYEEGTEIESGIDGCVGLNAAVSGNSLQWKVGGNENTVDHYTVYSSADGQSLTELTETKPGVSSVDLCQLSVPTGSHQLYVQAVGKASFANRMPGPVSYTAACSGSN